MGLLHSAISDVGLARLLLAATLTDDARTDSILVWKRDRHAQPHNHIAPLPALLRLAPKANEVTRLDNRAKLLFLSWESPWPPLGGGQLSPKTLRLTPWSEGCRRALSGRESAAWNTGFPTVAIFTDSSGDMPTTPRSAHVISLASLGGQNDLSRSLIEPEVTLRLTTDIGLANGLHDICLDAHL